MKKRRRSPRNLLIVFGTLTMIAVVSLWGLFRYYEHMLTPVDPDNRQEITVTIPDGATISEVGKILEDRGVIRKAWVFEIYARRNQLNRYQSGTFAFNRSMSAATIMNDLKTGKNKKIVQVVDVRQGMWISEVIPQMAKVSGRSEQEIADQLKDPDYVRSHYMDRYPFLTDEIFTEGVEYPLEGYLAPGVYRFEKGKVSIDQMVGEMLEKTKATVDRYQSKISSGPLKSVHRVLTMASLIEQEAPGEKDRRRIAGVFYNRLDKNMKLQSDPTVAYGQQRRTRQYTKKDLETDTPYNTYTRKGLTVGPIGSPGADAIDAALRPIRSDDLYFYARPNGTIYYSKTYAQHQEVVDKYRHEWASQS